MSMVFSRGCGKEIHESAQACPHCGAPQKQSGADKDIPEGVKGWSWGAFFLNWIWAIGNKTWIGLLCLIPYLGFIMMFVLGVKGREWAWKNKDWASVEEFNRIQRKWSAWGVGLTVGLAAIGILAAISIPAYQDYTNRAKAAQLQLEMQQAAEQQAAEQARMEAEMRQQQLAAAQAQREMELQEQARMLAEKEAELVAAQARMQAAGQPQQASNM